MIAMVETCIKKESDIFLFALVPLHGHRHVLTGKFSLLIVLSQNSFLGFYLVSTDCCFRVKGCFYNRYP